MNQTITASIDINKAAYVLKNVALKTPLQFHRKLSEKFGAEDLPEA
jgi:threonine dehydratase